MYYMDKAEKNRKKKEKEGMKKLGVGEKKGEDMIKGEKGPKEVPSKSELEKLMDMKKKILKKMKQS